MAIKTLDLDAYFNGPVWNDFGLSYSSYLVLPRVLLCGMPREWQEKFVALLDEARQTYDLTHYDTDYTVQLRNERGQFCHDSFTNYRHPMKIGLPYRREQE